READRALAGRSGRGSVPVGQTVSAVVAADGRLDEAGAIAVAAAHEGQPGEACVSVRHVRVHVAPARSHGYAGDRRTHHLAQLLFGHPVHSATTSTRSTMPIMAASTGAALRPSASPAARPSNTTRTFSLTPAPTPSTASIAGPRGESSGFSGCTRSSFAL